MLGVDSDWAAPRRRPMLDAVKEIARGISADPRSLPVIKAYDDIQQQTCGFT